MKTALFSLVLALSVSAFADKAAEERAAQAAVRQTIQSKLGSRQPVSFTKTDTSFLSASESRVTGKGYVGSSNVWNARNFAFSVKVRRDNYHTRDVNVEFEDSGNVSGPGDWTKPPIDSEFIGSISKPTNFQNFNSETVSFEGTATVGTIELRIYDRNNNMVLQDRVSARGGKWSAKHDLKQGAYRAVIGLGRMADSDEVRFSVRSNSSDWGTGGAHNGYILITRPQMGDSVPGNLVVFNGTARGDRVKLVVLDSSGRTVFQDDLFVRGSKWQTTSPLNPGRYRLEVSDSRAKDVLSFDVHRGGANIGGGSQKLSISSPRNNQNLGGLRASIEGTANTDTVRVQIFDERGREAGDTEVKVRNGRWQADFRLDQGKYRAKITSPNGRETDEAWFTYKGFGGSGDSGFNNDPISDEDRVTITTPKANATISSKTVMFDGKSAESSVRMTIFDSRGREVEKRTLSVKNGKWSVETQLPNGEFTLRIDAASGKDRDEKKFTRKSTLLTKDPL